MVRKPKNTSTSFLLGCWLGPTRLDEPDERLVLQFFDLFPDPTWDGKRKEEFYVFAETVRLRIEAGPHGVVGVAEVKDHKDHEQFFVGRYREFHCVSIRVEN